MAISTQAIRYGWVALASLGVITGTTIFVVNNMRKTVRPEDIIEIPLGTVEKSLGTQLTTNPPTYSIDPPSIVRTWTSNVYTTNGVSVYTNTATNIIGGQTDRDMMIVMDPKMKELPPFYTTNPPGRYTNSLVGLTVTGIFYALKIGNYGPHVTTNTNTLVISTNWGTNFTRTPCWTNQTVTNYLINYTNYYPYTNGATTNVIYTTTQYQVVSYATNWVVQTVISNITNAAHWEWGTISNWSSFVMNAVQEQTFTNYPSQIYGLDLVERYKFLNALSNHIRTVIVNGAEYTLGQRWTATVGWSCDCQDYLIYWADPWWTDPYGIIAMAGWDILLSGLHSPPSTASLRSTAAAIWGTIDSSVLTNTYYVTMDLPSGTNKSVRYFEKTTVSASTNATVGAIKSHVYGATGPFQTKILYPYDNQIIVSAYSSASLALIAGTYYLNRVYSNDAAVPEWMHGELNSNKFVTIVSITGSGGGLMDGEVLADSGSVGSWADLTTNDSPYVAASNIVDELLEVSAGNLDMPITEGTKTYSISCGGTFPYTIWFSEGADAVFHPYFQDTNGVWYDKFSYCTNKYW